MMALGWNKTTVSPIAVDFGADSLKLLQVIPGNPPVLAAAACVNVPADARSNPALRQAFNVRTLRDLMKRRIFRGRRAICSLPAYQTLTQHIQVQATDSAAELEDQVGLQLRQRLNLDPGRMVVRTFPIEGAARGGSGRQEVICVAAGRETVMQHVAALEHARLEVVGMHCEALAILNAFGHLYRREGDDGRCTCFIDLGASTTKIVIAHGSQLAFAKTIHAAGDHFTRHVASAEGVSFEQARAMRIARAAAGSSDSTEPTQAQARLAGLAMMEAPTAREHAAPATRSAAHAAQAPATNGPEETLECLIDELQMSLRHHQSLFPDRRVEKIVFLGGEAQFVDHCQRIARALRIGAQLGDPLARVNRAASDRCLLDVDMRRPQPGWAVPMGLCLSEANL